MGSPLKQAAPATPHTYTVLFTKVDGVYEVIDVMSSIVTHLNLAPSLFARLYVAVDELDAYAQAKADLPLMNHVAKENGDHGT